MKRKQEEQEDRESKFVALDFWQQPAESIKFSAFEMEGDVLLECDCIVDALKTVLPDKVRVVVSTEKCFIVSGKDALAIPYTCVVIHAVSGDEFYLQVDGKVEGLDHVEELDRVDVLEFNFKQLSCNGTCFRSWANVS
jgi:hypothetical protein